MTFEYVPYIWKYVFLIVYFRKSQLYSMTNYEIFGVFDTNSNVELATDGEDDIDFDDEINDSNIYLGKND